VAQNDGPVRIPSEICMTFLLFNYRHPRSENSLLTMATGIKKVRMCRSSMRTFRIQSLIIVSLSLYHGELLSAEIMAGLLARDSFSGRLPSLSTSDIMPFVLAYSGGSAGDLHPSSLSSPCGHRDPIFNFHKK